MRYTPSPPPTPLEQASREAFRLVLRAVNSPLVKSTVEAVGAAAVQALRVPLFDSGIAGDQCLTDGPEVPELEAAGGQVATPHGSRQPALENVVV